ncbi:hypothetical protein ACM39_10775 [Chryseobacterium sp. FH2]|uniref:hypothetical protein n=1 Tax=Chryseobacterium sp. FH2 TaxID=1674291 RepID=UPI00065AA8A8|nr:hypothetical protein [Chryseobacterium sp. FH2]KMQ67820.1 hypothetical protein ACM39_10775 [Chryseobacterium sp. FH2]
MKKLIIPFFCAVFFSVSLNAQTADAVKKTEVIQSKLTPKDVIDNYFKALGGKDKLEAIKSTITESTILAEGMEVSMISKKMGNKFKSVQKMGDKEIAAQAFDGEKGYINQMGNKAPIPADKIAELKKGKTIDELNYDPSNFKTVTVEKIEGKNYNVLASDKGSFYFDDSTGLLYKSVIGGGTVLVKEYMTVDGVKFQSNIEIQSKGQKVVIKTNKITVNSGVTDLDFKS